MNAATGLALADQSMRRDVVTWYAYLLLGFFTYLVSVQGNIIPFLQADLGLSYREVSLHASAIAVGTIIVGLFGDRLVRPFGRRVVLMVSALGCAGGAILLCLAPAAWASVGACLAIGLFGAFIPAIVPAVLSDIHGPRRDIAYAESNALCYAFAIMAPLIAALAAAMGWNWRLGLASGAAAGIAIALRFIRTPIPENRQPAKLGEARLPPAFWAYWAMLSFGVALEFAALLWAPAYLEKVIGLSPPAAPLVPVVSLPPCSLGARLACACSGCFRCAICSSELASPRLSASSPIGGVASRPWRSPVFSSSALASPCSSR